MARSSEISKMSLPGESAPRAGSAEIGPKRGYLPDESIPLTLEAPDQKQGERGRSSAERMLESEFGLVLANWRWIIAGLLGTAFFIYMIRRSLELFLSIH